MNPFHDAIARRAAGRCEYCRAPEAIANFPFEVEHILAQVEGGDDSDENLALSCRSCNVFKGKARNAVDPMTRENASLFHPRRDRWSEHFRVEGGEIIGLTPTGRATIVKLRMNSDYQREARILWTLLGLFP